MIYRHYKNFDEAFKNLNREILTNPKEMIHLIVGVQAFLEDIIIRVDEPVTTINLWEYAFDPESKWSHLIRSYIDPDEFYGFWENLPNITGLGYQFRFKNKTHGNGPCLIAIVLTRTSRKSLWTKAKVIWRTAELHRKWAADLVLLHNFFREIPQPARDLVKIEEVTLYLSQAFQSWRLIGPFIPSFCNYNDVDTSHEFGRKVISNFEKVFKEPQPKMKFKTLNKMQQHYKRLLLGDLPYTHPDQLSLIKELEKISKRGRG